MDGTFLATTTNAEYVALGTGGQRVIRCWDQITGYLQQSVGAEYAALFAEPAYNAATGTSDWYATGTGEAVRLADLPAEEQGAARERLGTLVAEIGAAAERLKQSWSAEQRLLSELLSLALVVPDENAVWVLRRGQGQAGAGEAGEGPALQPVLVGWGQTLAGQPPAPELLIGIAGAGRRPAGKRAMRIVGPPPPVAPARGWLWTLLSALLLALLLFLFALWTDPFGLLRVPPAQCVIAEGHLGSINALREAEAREARLRQEIAGVARELGQRRLDCPPPPAPAAPAAPPAPPQRTEVPRPPATSPDVERARERGAQSGRLQIILAWEDTNDLDLHVTCPNGMTIDFNQRAACGGALDTDANYQGRRTTTPVENIVFAGTPADGAYRIEVSHVPGPGPAVSRFRVTIRQEGRPDRVIPGQVSRGQRVSVGVANVPP
jgi:hypothetical protein